MAEPEQWVIAYWLVPAAPFREFFAEIIASLAARYDAPIFNPHLTVAVGPDSALASERALAGLTTAALELQASGIDFSEKFTRSLFVRFQPSPALRQLRASLGGKEDGGFDPHVSLLYQRLPEEEQARLASELQLPFAAVRFDAVAAIRCRIPVETAADVAVWKNVASAKL